MTSATIIALTDTAGDVMDAILLEAMKIYLSNAVDIIPFQFISSKEKIKAIMNRYADIPDNEKIYVHAFMSKELREYIRKKPVPQHDVIGPLLDVIEETTKAQNQQTTIRHQLDDAYFDRIEAIEFTVNNDDGKNPSGLVDADIVLLGVSRTGKTPLSMILANRNVRVANLPIMPEADIPYELYHVEHKKIIGLMTTPKVLENYRTERMKSYGLDETSYYASPERIIEELNYAKDLYQKLDCDLVINTSERSIEESAAIILAYMEKNKLLSKYSG